MNKRLQWQRSLIVYTPLTSEVNKIDYLVTMASVKGLDILGNMNCLFFKFICGKQAKQKVSRCISGMKWIEITKDKW